MIIDNSNCPVCTETLDPKKGVVSTSHGWMHPACEKKYTAAKAKLSGSMSKRASAHRQTIAMSPAPVLLAPLIPPGPFPSPSRHTIETMTANVREQLAVGLRDIVPEDKWAEAEAWAKDRASNIVQSIAGNFTGDCRACGAVPIREASDRTGEINVAVAR